MGSLTFAEKKIPTMKISICLLATMSLMGCSTVPIANRPLIQTKGPIIHLADNLDEQDSLGWCIDTDGKDFSNTLQAHSCKPEGNDVLFSYNDETLQICSVTYPGYCAAMIGGPRSGMTISLVKSDPDSSDQKFSYHRSSGEFRPVSNSKLCLAVDDASDSAGPYMSRKLTLKPRGKTKQELKQWVVQR